MRFGRYHSLDIYQNIKTYSVQECISRSIQVQCMHSANRGFKTSIKGYNLRKINVKVTSVDTVTSDQNCQILHPRTQYTLVCIFQTDIQSRYLSKKIPLRSSKTNYSNKPSFKNFKFKSLSVIGTPSLEIGTVKIFGRNFTSELNRPVAKSC